MQIPQNFHGGGAHQRAKTTKQVRTFLVDHLRFVVGRGLKAPFGSVHKCYLLEGWDRLVGGAKSWMAPAAVARTMQFADQLGHRHTCLAGGAASEGQHRADLRHVEYVP